MFILLLILSPVILIFVGLPLMAVIAVQKRLCRKNSKWVGLILPAAALVYGLFLTVTMSVVMFHYDAADDYHHRIHSARRSVLLL